MIEKALVDLEMGGRLCLTLLHSMWQVALLALVAWCFDRLWRNRSVERCYAVNVAALVACVALMPITYLLLGSSQPTSIAVMETPAIARAVESESVSNTPRLERTTESPNETQALVRQSNTNDHALSSVASDSLPITQASQRSSFEWLSLAPWIVAFYTAGVALMLIRLVVAFFKANRLTAGAEILTNGPLVEALRSISNSWSMKVVPVLAQVEKMVVPKVVGLARPTILLPVAAISGLSTEQLEMILAHELAHVRRYDMWINLLQRLAEAVLFFNPVLWHLSRRISTLREYCCDEMTCRVQSASIPEPRLRYAAALVRIVELAKPSIAANNDLASLAASGRSPSDIRRRVARLLGEPLREPLRISRGGVIVVAATVLLLFAGPAVWQSRTQSLAQEGTASQELLETDAIGSMQKTLSTKDRASKTANVNRATISGRIVMEDGSPATTKGRMYYNSQSERGGNQGNAGQFTDRFSFSAPAGTIWLSYYTNDYAPAWAGPFELGPGKQHENVTIVLKPGFSELVKVTNELGKPVTGATLVAHPEINGSVGGPIFEKTTDAKGEFLLEHLADTRYGLRIIAPGYQPLQTAPLRVEPGEVLRPTMVRSQPNTGIVRYADGTPAAGAKLRGKSEYTRDGKFIGFLSTGDGFWGDVFITADSQGRFKLDQLSSGSHYFFIVEAVDGARAVVHDLQAGQQDVQIVLPRRRDLVVRITGDISKLPRRNGKPFVSIRQQISFEPASGKRFGELIGADAPVEITENGGLVIFRGLAVDLKPDAKKQYIKVSLGYDQKTAKAVELNLIGGTVVEFDVPAKEPEFKSARTSRSPVKRNDHSAIWFHSDEHVHFVLYHQGYLQSGLSYTEHPNTQNTPSLWKFRGHINALGGKRVLKSDKPGEPNSKKGESSPTRRFPIVFNYRPPGFLLYLDGKEYDLELGRVFVLHAEGELTQLAIQPPSVADVDKIDQLKELVQKTLSGEVSGKTTKESKRTPEARRQPQEQLNADTKDNKKPFEFQLKVVGPDGAAVPNASVEIRTSPKPKAEQISRGKFVRAGSYGTFATADDEGRLALKLPRQPKRFNISIKHAGFGPYWAGWNSQDQPQAIPQKFTAQLDEGWSVGGVVVDAFGNPLKDVEVKPSVYFKKRPGDTKQLGIGTRILTDAEGKWRFESVPISKDYVHVQVNHLNYQPLRQRLPRNEFEIKRGAAPTGRIELKPGLTVKGKVTDESGKPIAGALVRTKFGNDLRETKTNEQGEYLLKGCEPRMARIVVSAKGRALDMQEVRVDPTMKPVNFSMKPGGKIRIRVVDEQGKGIPKAIIALKSWRGGMYQHFQFDHVSRYADENGVWEWDEAPLDEIKADIVRLDGMHLSYQSLIARDEEYVFKPPRLLVISGTVIDAVTKKPIKQFRVVPGVRDQPQQRAGNTWKVYDSFVAKDGKYRIAKNQSAPAHMVRIEADGYQIATSREIMMDEGEVNFDFELQPAKDIAAVIVTATGKPAAKAKVVLGIAGSQIMIHQGEISDRQTYATRTNADAEGRFSFPPRDEPFHIVITHPAGFAHLKSEDGPIPSRIKLTPWARVEGTFRIGPKPAPNIVLSKSGGIFTSGKGLPSISTYHEATTGKEGRFVFERVFPGRGYIGRNIVLMVDEGAIEVTSSLRVWTKFVAGETTKLNLGGSGRPVIGKLIPPVGYTKKVFWNFAIITVQVDLKSPSSPVVPKEIQKDPEKRKAWWEAWVKTDEGKAWTVAYEAYNELRSESPGIMATVDRDGSFRIDDVPSGKYVLGVRFDKNASGALRNYRFTVPPVEKGSPAQRIDLGTLPLKTEEPRAQNGAQ